MIDQPEKPKLSVVAQNTQQQIETNEAQDQVNAALLELAANIIRVVRGAGKPEQILHQCSDVVNAAVEYRDAAGRLPSPATLASAILLEREVIDYNDSFWAARQIAYRRIVRGSLQVAASKLLGQRLQIDRGEDEIDESIQELEHLREEIRRKRAAEQRAMRPKISPRKRTLKPKGTKKV
ncbi:hypothetical protein PMI07_002054 [Rhizobium sp. CF080]|uniref:hypothetical protein n=1 Tax=Rhizobium sp. (strain CF080) TaxID=1144310 RepID=UPI000271D656|nr:hypothetical protein [Rhizobium sp. CF080]EUB95566.1 hypothetical protein PMI07_002054 [Rhizobium sp. CF080]